MDNRYSREKLDAMSIFVLRDVARKFGHSSATTQKKQELIDYIVEKNVSGMEKTDDAPKKRRGRPPKAVTLAIEEVSL